MINLKNNLPKITFINPPGFYSQKSLSYWGPTPPLGLAYIVANVKKHKFPLEVLDCVGEDINLFTKFKTKSGELILNGLSLERILKRVDLDTNVFAISHLFLHQWPFISELCKELKEKCPSALIILGGENASSFSHYILKNQPAIDYCVVGEGEEIFLNLLENLKEKKELNTIEGISFRENNSIKKNKRYSRIKNIQKLPWPAWEEFPIENYLKSKDGMGYHKGRSLSIMATRGCPYHCSFCSAPDLWTNQYNLREPQDVLKEMKHLMKKFNVENFNFSDLTLIANIQWVRNFCQLLKNEKLNITWQLPSGTRSEVLKEDVLKLMKETGVNNLNLSPESGSPDFLKLIKKKVNLQKFQEVQKKAQRIGIKTEANIIIGHPKERRRDLLKTFYFVFKLNLAGLNDLSPIIFTPYPGSEDFKILERNNEIEFSEDYFYSSLNRMGNARVSYNDSIGTRELIFYQYLFLILFYGLNYFIRPLRILKIIKNVFEKSSNGQMESFLKKKFLRQRSISINRF